MNQRDVTLATWFCQLGHAIATRYGIEYLCQTRIEVSERSIAVTCATAHIAKVVWEARWNAIAAGFQVQVLFGRTLYGED
jgi:hypothetical protein